MLLPTIIVDDEIQALRSTLDLSQQRLHKIEVEARLHPTTESPPKEVTDKVGSDIDRSAWAEVDFDLVTRSLTMSMKYMAFELHRCQWLLSLLTFIEQATQLSFRVKSLINGPDYEVVSFRAKHAGLRSCIESVQLASDF